ncbi:ThuA domain-containing protein [Halomicrobium salinisoli]|uniref:ThuA domain-containing protein n=1 Tax=Halomicrobium salinisoli TaxID=2878391 RepID=UPI001CF010F5|nr:ThuA domain-containing protein [Halomicrobium salinisoli]
MTSDDYDYDVPTDDYGDRKPRFPTNRRQFLQAASAGAATLSGLAGLSSAQQGGGNVIELEAVTVETSGGRGRSEYAWEDGDGGVARGPPEEVCNIAGGTHVWVGVSPSSIADLTNPTLELAAGETYTVEWTNTDGEEHNFVIADADGNELVSSETVSEEGATQSVEFTATEEMATYYCGPHSGSQSGSIDVGSGEPAPENPASTAIQFWTLRDLGYSTAEIIRLVGAVDNNGGPGYDAVEPYQLSDSSPSDVRTALDETGLEAPFAHVGFGGLEGDSLEGTLDDWYDTVGVRNFVIPWVAPDEMNTVEKAQNLAERMNAVAENLPDDARLGYHTHNQEFMEIGDGRTPLEVIDENLNDDVILELDVGWAYHAGEDPVEVLRQYSDRIQLIHLKEMNRGDEAEFITLGEGEMDVAEIASVARNEVGVEYLIYENDEPADEKAELSTAGGVMSFVDGRAGLECLDFADVGSPGYDGSLSGVPMGDPADEDGIPTGIQLYTLRDLPDSTPELIRRVGAIDDNGGPGYDTIEFAGIDGSVSDVQTALDDTGVDAVSAHIGLDSLEGDSLQDTVDTYSQFGIDYYIVPSIRGVDENATEDSVQQLAERFNAISENLGDDGTVGFHNHAAVFTELDDDRTILEVLDEHLNDDVVFEIDVGWVLTAGHDPVEVISKYSDRVQLLHMKDMADGDFHEVGEGAVDWEAVADVAQNEANVDHIIYEHDVPSDPAGSTGTGAGFLSFVDGAPGLECLGLSDIGGPDYSGTLSGAPGENEVNLMILSATPGYRHGNIEYGIQRLKEEYDRIASRVGADGVNYDVIAPNGPAESFPTDASELEMYDAIIWFNSVGNVLADQAQRDAFEEYIQNGGGYVGIHAACDTHHPGDGEWDFYLGMLGDAYFVDHPEPQEAEITVTDQVHPSTDHLPARWTVTDEWYDFAANPRGDVHVLASLDEDSYDGATMENGREDHPIAWCQEYQGGKAWYTGRGHTEGAFDEDAFIEHVVGGIAWAGGFEEGDATGTVWDSYSKSEITTDLGEPMKMDTTPDGRLLYTERVSGDVSVYHPESGEVTTALSLDVYSGQEDGLQGVAVDPDFEENGWVYVYYAPPNDVVGDDPYNLLSRFTMDGDTIDPASETEIMRVHTQRQTCCHVGGDIAFGPDGELYLSTGDDTNPFHSSGYTPIDERSGEWTEEETGDPEADRVGQSHEYWDAQRTAGNTNDLRGSILRIVPEDDGGYSVPDGNLFTGDEYADARENNDVREEIYVMGCRNPFTIDVDEETGRLYFADYGPDAGSWDPERGPLGMVEITAVDEPGFYGWPYFTGSNIPYVDYDFETGESSGPFDPQNPVNDSPNNTGLEDLPPAEGATVFYPFDWSELIDNAPDYAQEYVPDEIPYPEIGTGGAPMTGPLFRHEDDFGDSGLPEYFDGKQFTMEWGANWLKYVSYDEDGELLDIEPFLPDTDFAGPQDIAVGQNGELYVMEYGNCYFGCEDSGLYVIEQESDQTEPEPDPDPEQVSVPYGLDSGGETDDQSVTVGDLEFDALPNAAVTQTGEHTATTLLEADGDYSIDGTDNDLLYKTEHYGADIGYDVQIPNGTYDVTFHFAEIWWGVEGRGGTDTGEGDRVFDVSVQGETVLSGYDIYAEVGALTAATETIEGVEVTDGTLSISSTTQADNTKFSGIEIRPSDGGGNESPTAEFTPSSTSVAPGDAVTFDASGSSDSDGSIESYEWTFGDGSSATGQSVEHSYGSAGEYDVTLTVTDDAGATATAMQTITVESDSPGIDPSTTIRLDGYYNGWEAAAPDSIAGDTNPTLQLQEGETYTVEWNSADGAPHDFDVRNASGDTVVNTDVITSESYSSVEVTVTSDMAEYVCSVHPGTMLGSIEVV